MAKSQRKIENAALLFRPFVRFAQLETSGGILLIIATLLALFWANSPWAHYYDALWHTKIGIEINHHYGLTESLLHWVNDGLMAVFFFVVGLEIKREILVGELATPKKALLPIAGALGGMLVPALIYVFFNWKLPSAHGWGIPMATDIAFALGVLTLLGPRVPIGLKVFLTALAIVDDLGAVLVIAIFYPSNIVLLDLYFGAGALILLMFLNRMGVRNPLIYAIFGIGGLWLAFLFSGVHATIAGVLAAFTIPARTRLDAKDFLKRGKEALERFGKVATQNPKSLPNDESLAEIDELSVACNNVQAPLQSLEHALQPWVVYFILPIFALANAGVKIDTTVLSDLLSPVSIGIFMGLVFGKQLGIFSFAWLMVKLKLADLPKGATWFQLYGVSILGGIGFTMSLFVTNLAFRGAEHLPLAKLTILISSLFAGLLGYLVLTLKASKTEKKSQLV